MQGYPSTLPLRVPCSDRAFATDSISALVLNFAPLETVRLRKRNKELFNSLFPVVCELDICRLIRFNADTCTAIHATHSRILNEMVVNVKKVVCSDSYYAFLLKDGTLRSNLLEHHVRLGLAPLASWDDVEDAVSTRGMIGFLTITGDLFVIFDGVLEGHDAFQKVSSLALAIQSTMNSIAYLCQDSRVLTVTRGVFASDLHHPVDDVMSIFSTNAAFAVIKKDGTVHAWGSPEFGGHLSETIPPFKAERIYANDRAFLAITDSGKVYTWGDMLHGGNGWWQVPGIDCLSHPSILTCNTGFAALHGGAATIWPHEDNPAAFEVGDRVVANDPEQFAGIMVRTQGLVSKIADDDEVQVRWEHGHSTNYPTAWLRKEYSIVLENIDPAQISLACEGVEEHYIVFDNLVPAELGVTWTEGEQCLTIASIQEGGLIDRWNKLHHSTNVKLGHRIIAAKLHSVKNGRGSLQLTLKESKYKVMTCTNAYDVQATSTGFRIVKGGDDSDRRMKLKCVTAQSPQSIDRKRGRLFRQSVSRFFKD